jgi:hypothetical protein
MSDRSNHVFAAEKMINAISKEVMASTNTPNLIL